MNQQEHDAYVAFIWFFSIYVATMVTWAVHVIRKYRRNSRKRK